MELVKIGITSIQNRILHTSLVRVLIDIVGCMILLFIWLCQNYCILPLYGPRARVCRLRFKLSYSVLLHCNNPACIYSRGAESKW